MEKNMHGRIARVAAAAGLGLTLALGAAPVMAIAEPDLGNLDIDAQDGEGGVITTVDGVFDGGEGTESSPYIISQADTLASFAQSVNSGNDYLGKYVELSGNIDLSRYESWTPIGTEEHPFSGVFDGSSFTVTGLQIKDETLSGAGLFGVIKGGAIENLTIDSPNVSAKSYVGALVGDAFTGSISNCKVSGMIAVSGYYKIGGLTGNGYANINDCSVAGSDGSYVSATYLEPDLEGDSVGGLIGYRGEGSVELSGCSVSGVAISGTRKVGGLAGSVYTTNVIEDCEVSSVAVSSTATKDYAESKASSMGVGGLVGIITSDKGNSGSIEGCEISDVTLSCDEGAKDSIKMGYVTGGMYADDVSAPSDEQMELSAVVTGNNSGANVDAPGLNGAVASIGEDYYNTLADAVDAVETNETITLLHDVTGSGVKVAGEGERTFTIDLGGNTYTVVNPTVGSSGTETNGFQLLEGSTITIKNGTITAADSASAKILIQNYSNLTLEDVNLIGGTNTQYTLSNNCGNVVIGEGTSITAGGASPNVAFDVCRFADYDSVVVTVNEGAGKITGKIELSHANAASGNGEIALNIKGGDFSGSEIVYADPTISGEITVSKDSSVALSAPDGYQWVDKGEGPVLTPATGEGDEDPFVPVASIGDVMYGSLATAIDSAQPGQTVELLGDVTVETWDMVWDVAGITLDGNDHTLTVKNIESGQNHNALIQSDGDNTFKNLKIDLSDVEAEAGGKAYRAFSAGAGDSFSNVAIKGNENLEYGISVDGTDADNETVTIDGCTFDNIVYGVYDSEEGSIENLVITNSTFSGCDYASILHAPNAEFTGNVVEGGKLNIVNEGQVIDGNTFTDESLIKFYASPESFEKNIISADSHLEKDDGLEDTVDISKNYWGGGAPSKDQLGNAAGSVTGSDVYYERDTMRPQDLNTYVPPVVSTGDAVKVEQSEGGKVTVSPSLADEGDEVTVTVAPDEGQELRELTVTDSEGNGVEAKAGEKDGEYVFVMPDGAVTVTATFGCDGGELCPTHGFSDVDQSDWYHDAVDWAVESGVLNGYGDGGELLGPLAMITRAEMAQVLWNKAGRPEAEADLSAFADVDASAWYAAPVAWCLSEGIFNGYGDTFGTERPISREEVATVLWRMSGESEAGSDLSGYADASAVSAYATDALSWATGSGVVTGKDSGTRLDPQGQCTRAEVAAMLMRMAG